MPQPLAGSAKLWKNFALHPCFDGAKAVALYKLAAGQGLAVAETNLGIIYETGADGVPFDGPEAVRLYQLAAAQGEALAENNLSSDYLKGESVAENDGEALRLFKLSAAQGCVMANGNVAILESLARNSRQNSAK